MAKLLFAAFYVGMFCLTVFRGACADEGSAVRAMEYNGHTNVKVLGHKWFVVGLRGCEATDAALFPVVSTNSAGKTVPQIVCVGWPFKAATIRTE
jgi:hypothetical protein